MKHLTNTLESATRKKIDIIMSNLGWNVNEHSKDCNVFTERAKTIEQNKKFKGKKPDYVLYKSGTDKPIAIIETKRVGQSLKKASVKLLIVMQSLLECILYYFNLKTPTLPTNPQNNFIS